MGAGILAWNGFPSFAQGDNVNELKQQIAALQKRVAELEAAQAKAALNSPAEPDPMLRSGPGTGDPFEEMARMQAEMNRMFQSSFNWGGPFSKGMFRSNMYYDDKFNIKEEKDKYVVELDMMGLNQGKMDIHVDQHSLTVKGEREEDKKEEGQNKYFSAKSYSSFIKTIPLPADADTTKMKSENNGEKLIITLPKKAR